MKREIVFGIWALLGLFSWMGCEEDEDDQIWIEEGKREIVLGAEGETDAIRVENVGWITLICAVECGDTTCYYDFEKTPSEVKGDWFYVKLETNDVLIVQVDSNKSHEPRQLLVDLYKYPDWDRVHVTQKGEVKPVK